MYFVVIIWSIRRLTEHFAYRIGNMDSWWIVNDYLTKILKTMAECVEEVISEHPILDKNYISFWYFDDMVALLPRWRYDLDDLTVSLALYAEIPFRALRASNRELW